MISFLLLRNVCLMVFADLEPKDKHTSSNPGYIGKGSCLNYKISFQIPMKRNFVERFFDCIAKIT